MKWIIQCFRKSCISYQVFTVYARSETMGALLGSTYAQFDVRLTYVTVSLSVAVYGATIANISLAVELVPTVPACAVYSYRTLQLEGSMLTALT